MAWVAPFDPFEALGLERGATPRTIRSKYHELARRYHPNRNQGTDDSKAALSEYFHYVNQAWQLLSEPEKRRRYIELLNLYELHEAILASTADLLDNSNTNEHRSDHHKASDGQISSDADDDDLPRIAGLKKRETFDHPTKGLGGLDGIPEDSDSDQSLPKDDKSRQQSRASQLRGRIDSGRDSDASEQNVAAERRRKFVRLRRKELEAFHNYRDAMVEKFEAEEAAERSKELFERARWRREYFERAPRETNQRMRLIRLFHNATKAFTAQQLPVGRRKGSSVSQGGQILSTGDPLQQSNNQLLSLPSRTKSIRRKGFTSDISADQTSSDEDQSDEKAPGYKRHARTASSPAPNHRRHRSGDTIPTSLRLTPRRLPNANQDPISPVTGPGPNIFVRAATNLQEIANEEAEQAMNGAPVSASSRSSSPEEVDTRARGRFKLLPHFSTSEMFGSEREGRSRSVSADRRTTRVNGNLPRTPSPYSDASFSIKQIGLLEYKNIATEHVHELSDREKQWLLSVEPDADTNPVQLLQHLARLDSTAAARLTVKADIKKDFKFRLIYSHREVVKTQHQSFIALSYRRKLHVEKKNKHFSLPLDDEMFQAVWDERMSDKEGVWIDQICIDQDSDMEKNVSMSAMDMVYRSARLVVVALDDIVLDAQEGQILQSHMEEFNRQSHVAANKRFRRRQPPYLDKHDDLYLVIRKIMRSSWFKRAWCRHEMRLAREHIFLVPCHNPGSPTKGVLRFTGKTLTHFLGMATEVAFEPAIEAVKPALYAFFRDRSKLSPEHHLRSHHGNFTTVVAEVFAMEAGGDPKVPDEQREADARKDKVAIILNTMECGLALRQEVRRADFSLPMYECNFMLLLLALAARDPGALCSVGHPLRELPYNLSSSWLLEPTNVDSGLNNYRTLNRLPERFHISTQCEGAEQYVRLGLKFLSPGRVVRPLESAESTLAKFFMEVCDQRRLGRNRKRYLLNDKTANQLFGSMRDIYIQVLVCLFECGPDWMSEVCQRYGVSRWKYDLPHAYDLLIAFKNTNGNWPEHAWRSEAAGFIMDFVNFLIIRGLPQRQTTQSEEWRPICVSTSDGIGKVLTFIPPGDIRVAVPAALLDADYLHLARLFVMEPRGRYDPDKIPHYSEWTLRGKSVLFSDETALDLLELDNGTIRGGQAVFGRT